MLRLFLLRHAEAMTTAAEGDKARRLTEKGVRDALQFGDYCLKAGFIPDEALVSSALRASETFEALIKSFPQKPRVNFESALYNATAQTLHGFIQTTSATTLSLLIIGHNPGIAELAFALASESASNWASLETMRRHFPAPALAIFEFNCATWAETAAGCGTLQCFLTSPSLQSGHRS